MSRYSRLTREQAAVMGVATPDVTLERGGKASTDGRHIYLDAAFMAEVEGEAGEGGVRFVLAHEIAHGEHGMAGGHGAELKADEFAARSLARSGVTYGAIDRVMDRVIGIASSRTHPDGGRRGAHARRAWSDAWVEQIDAHDQRDQALRLRADVPPTKRADRNKNVREHAI